MTQQMTRADLEALRAELAELEGPARREIAARIRTAREWGDLKENAEYHDAKNDQAFLETRIARLNERLRGAEVVDEVPADGEVRVGSRVEVRDEESGRTLDVRLAGGGQADAAAGTLSVESPLAQAALGRRAGDVLVVPTPRGDRRYVLVAVR